MSQRSRSRSWQQDRHHGLRTTLLSLPLTQNPVGLARQWMQSGKVYGRRGGSGLTRGRGASGPNALAGSLSAAIR
ncbi:MAG: hypothetical protein ACXV3F_00240 [Frankiaceae bacterium]